MAEEHDWRLHKLNLLKNFWEFIDNLWKHIITHGDVFYSNLNVQYALERFQIFQCFYKADYLQKIV